MMTYPDSEALSSQCYSTSLHGKMGRNGILQSAGRLSCARCQIAGDAPGENQNAPGMKPVSLNHGKTASGSAAVAYDDAIENLHIGFPVFKEISVKKYSRLK